MDTQMGSLSADSLKAEGKGRSEPAGQNFACLSGNNVHKESSEEVS